MTLLHRPSKYLNKSFTILKETFLWKRTRINFELEIWQRIKYFFLRPARSTIIPLSEPTRTMTLLHRPSNYFEQVLYYTGRDFLWKRTRVIFELEIWQRIKYFFLRPARSTIIPLSEPNRIMTLLHRPSNYLNKSFTILKETFYENAQE